MNQRPYLNRYRYAIVLLQLRNKMGRRVSKAPHFFFPLAIVVTTYLTQVLTS